MWTRSVPPLTVLALSTTILCGCADPETSCDDGAPAGSCTEVCATPPCASSCSEPWVIDVVDPAGTSDDEPGVVIDASGTVHVSFLKDLRLTYARRPAGSSSWNVEPVAEAIYSNSAIAVDAQGGVHILYLEGGTYRVTIADRAQTGEWTLTMLAGLGRAHVLLSLVADASSGLHAVASIGPSEDTQGLRYYHRAASSSWSSVYIDSTSHIRGPASLALDASVTPHVTYWDDVSKQVIYAHSSTPNENYWATEMVDAVAYGASPSIGIAPDGRIQLSYLEPSMNEFRAATRADRGTWTPTSAFAGPYESTAMAIDSAGRVHVALGDAIGITQASAHGPLAHLERPANGAWTTTEIVPFGVDGRPALALDPAGGVHIVFHDDLSGALKHAYRAPCR